MFRKLTKYYKPHAKLFALDLASAVILAVLSLVFPRVVGNVIDRVLPAGDFRALYTWGAVLLLLYAVNYVLMYIADYGGHYLGTLMEYDMRKEIFQHIHTLPFSYFDNTKTGQIMSRIVNDLDEIAEMAHHAAEDILTIILTFAGVLIVMLSMNIRLTLLLLLPLPFMTLYAIRQNKKISAGYKNMRENMGEINANVEDSIGGVRVVKSFTNESYEQKKFDQSNKTFTKLKAIAYKNEADFYPLMDLTANIMYLAVLVYGGYLVYNNRLSLGGLVGFILYVSIFLRPVRQVAFTIDQYQRGMASFTRFQEIMQIKPAITDDPDAVDIGAIKGRVELQNVTFGYNNHTNILKGINLTISPGETVAVVGPSGGGKTTLCNLIPRFYEIDEGKILVDGIDIRSVTQKSLRRNIGNVQQEVFLFAGSVRENLQYGRLDATEAELVEAAKKAEAHDFIMALPNGYDTFIGERGVKLSGGQRQRIAIARVFLKNPPLLILDEATSALDHETETHIQKSLYRLAENRTTLVIAHRLTTIKTADRILVLTDDGIVEQGSHDELMKIDGMYAGLYASGAM